VHVKDRQPGPWRFALVAIVVLVLALAIVGIVGVLENQRLQAAAERAVTYDVAVAAAGDDIKVDVLDLRFSHRNIVFSGPTSALISEFDQTYERLLTNIELLEQIGISDLDVPQPSELRELAIAYHDAFRPSIVLFTVDPVAFNQASTTGLAQLDQLEAQAQQINDAGNQLTTSSLADISAAADRERNILLALLLGVALIGALLAISAGRFLHRLQAANAAEQEASRQLAATLRAKTDFIADASHELRTPLTLIRGNAEIGLQTSDPNEQEQLFSEIQTESTRMSHLVNDLLFLARSDAGSPPIEKEFLPARLLADRLLPPSEALTRSQDKTLATSVDCAGDLEADPQRIQQAVLILIDNACRFSPDGQPVELSMITIDGQMAIAVHDHGPGIPAEEQSLIFERFYQAPQTQARKRGGAGLGLAIARSIVEAHQGTIALASTPETGTHVTIRLPLSGDARE
jgi:two-component system sensor histidine kinase VicK